MPWGIGEPLESMDFASIAALVIVEVSLALAALYVAANRTSACYAMVPELVLSSAMAGIVTNLAVALRYGWWSTLTAKPYHLIGCAGEAWLLWLGSGALFACAFLRVYRNHKVLIRHNSVMWPVPLQLGVVLLPFLLAPTILTARAGLLVFEEDTQECERMSEKPEAFALGVIVVLTAATVALTRRLWAVRFQAPAELSAATKTSAVSLLAVFVLPVLHQGLEAERNERRRAMLVASSLLTVAIIIAPLWGTLKSFICAYDIETEARGEHGLRKPVQPGTILKIAQDRMEINALESSSGGRNIPEFSAMAWFFRDSLDREMLRDYFSLQASTMRILGRYVWEGAPMFIFLSSACRAEVLTSEASSPFIFTRARQEIMARMGGGAITFLLSPPGTIAPGDTIFGDSTSTGTQKISTTPPLAPPQPNQRLRKLPVGAILSRPPKVNLAYRTKNSSRASISGGEMKRNRFGTLGRTSEVSAAFGLHPDIDHESTSGDNPSRGKRQELFVSRSRTGSKASDFGRAGAGVDVAVGGAGGSSDGGGSDDGDGGGCVAYPIEQDEQQRHEEKEAVAEVASDPSESDSVDDLDPFMGLQGTFDFNFAESSISFPGLSASLRLPATQMGNHTARRKNTRKKNAMENSVMSISGSSDDDNDEDDDDDGDVVVVNPLFVDELNQTVRRQSK